MHGTLTRGRSQVKPPSTRCMARSQTPDTMNPALTADQMPQTYPRRVHQATVLLIGSTLIPKDPKPLRPLVGRPDQSSHSLAFLGLREREKPKSGRWLIPEEPDPSRSRSIQTACRR